MSAAPQSRGAVVVGVDGSSNSSHALRFALQEGIRRRVAVRVVTAWMTPNAPSLSGAAQLDHARDEVGQMQARSVDQALRLATDDEAPEISRELVLGYGDEALLEAARDAAVLVIGHTKRRWAARSVLGSVSQQCLRRSPVPVIVVPPPERANAYDTETEASALGGPHHPYDPGAAPRQVSGIAAE